MHASYYLSMAETAVPKLFRPEYADWGEQLEVEHHNLLAALQWAVEERQVEQAVRLALVLGKLAIVRGFLRDGLHGIRAAVALLTGAQHAALRVETLCRGGTLAALLGELPGAYALFEEALSMCRAQDDLAGTSDALAGLGFVAGLRVQWSLTYTLSAECVVRARDARNQEDVAYYQTVLANAAYQLHDLAAARALLTEAEVTQRQLGDLEGLQWSLQIMGLLAQNEHDYARAEHYFQQSLAINKHMGFKIGLGQALLLLGDLALDLGSRGAADHVLARA